MTKELSINLVEAKAFVLQAVLSDLTESEALAQLKSTTWVASPADRAFGRRPHTPTIRRLARAQLVGLDARCAAQAEIARQKADEAAATQHRWEALSETDKASVREATASARGKRSNRAACDLARALGLHAIRSIGDLRALVG